MRTDPKNPLLKDPVGTLILTLLALTIAIAALRATGALQITPVTTTLTYMSISLTGATAAAIKAIRGHK